MKFIGLLRGINVGGHGKLPMKSLLGICADQGYQNTKHYIQSGNIVFETNTPPDPLALSVAIEQAHGFAPKILFFEAGHFEAIAKANPFANDIPSDHHKYLHQFMFLETPNSSDLDAVASKAMAGEQWQLRDHCFDLYAPNGAQNSKLARDIEKMLKISVTARNWLTVTKLREMIL